MIIPKEEPCDTICMPTNVLVLMELLPYKQFSFYTTTNKLQLYIGIVLLSSSIDTWFYLYLWYCSTIYFTPMIRPGLILAIKTWPLVVRGQRGQKINILIFGQISFFFIVYLMKILACISQLDFRYLLQFLMYKGLKGPHPEKLSF